VRTRLPSWLTALAGSENLEPHAGRDPSIHVVGGGGGGRSHRRAKPSNRVHPE
jgi:hypothetical protein